LDLSEEIETFDDTCRHLKLRVRAVSGLDSSSVDAQFIAEAICFKLFRVQERLTRSFFLHCCTAPETLAGKKIKAKLVCPDFDVAEAILKGQGRFIEWGKVEEIKKLSNLIFEKGYPVSDFLVPNSQIMSDLHKIRNYIAHDSKEARSKFVGVAKSYIRVEDEVPEQAGVLLLYRKRPSDSNFLTKIFGKVRQFSRQIESL